MDFTGRPMKNWLYVSAEGTKTKARARLMGCERTRVRAVAAIEVDDACDGGI
jgi:hypothetical protein